MARYGNYYGGSYGYYSQPSTAELQAKAAASIAGLQKKGRVLNPIHLEGTKLARTWWGKAWCDNIDRYADFSNRVDRGKRYVRADCVIDLQVSKGRIEALVQGTRKKPYEVAVGIASLTDDAFAELMGDCTARADSLEALAAGDFPNELKQRLLVAGGLFPAPAQIGFTCSCPDSASLCKHIAAAIMAVAPQLDETPLLLFELRGVDTAELVKRTVAEKLDLMLANADAPSERIMDMPDADLTALFGVL